MLHNSLYEITIHLMQKPGKDNMRKENYWVNLMLINIIIKSWLGRKDGNHESVKEHSTCTCHSYFQDASKDKIVPSSGLFLRWRLAGGLYWYQFIWGWYQFIWGCLLIFMTWGCYTVPVLYNSTSFTIFYDPRCHSLMSNEVLVGVIEGLTVDS